MNVLFWGRCNFPISFYARDISMNIWNQSLRKFYGRYGDLFKQYEVPLPRMLHDDLEDDYINWQSPLIRHYKNPWPFTELDLITEFDPFFTKLLEVYMEHFNGCGIATDLEDACSSRHLVLSYFGTYMCCNVETNFSQPWLISGLSSFQHPAVFLFYFKNTW